MKIPKKLPECADMLKRCRDERFELQRSLKDAEITKRIDELKRFENELRDYLLDELPAQGMTGVIGKVATALETETDIPVIEDREKFLKWYVNTKRDVEDLIGGLNLSNPAVRARWQDGIDIPGVGVFKKKDISVRKA